MAKTGPKRKIGVERYKGGQIKHADRVPKEAPDAVASEARIRHLLGVDKWLECKRNPAAMAAACKLVSDQDLGSPLGRLRRAGREDGLSRSQFAAACYFGRLVRERNNLRRIPTPNVRSPDYGAVPTPSGEPPAPVSYSEYDKGSPEWEEDILDKFNVMYGAVIEADRGRGTMFEVLKRVVIEELMPARDEVGDIRIALNAIDRARSN